MSGLVDSLIDSINDKEDEQQSAIVDDPMSDSIEAISTKIATHKFFTLLDILANVEK